MTRFKYYFSFLIIALTIGLLLYIYFISFFPYEPVTLNQSPIKILTKEVKPGENVKYEIRFTKNMNIKPEIKYYLIDGTIVELNPSGGVNRPLGKQIRTNELQIPKSTRPNTYHIQIDLIYRVNFLQTRYYSWVSEEFYVK